MSFLVRHLLDIGWTLLDTEIIGAFFERTHARHHNNRRKTRTYWTLRVKRVYWLDTNMYKTLNVPNALHLSSLRLKKCSFDWHLKRFGVLLGGTCETLRLVGPCWLDTCKSFWTQWSLLVPLLLYHKSNCLFTQY